MPRVRVSASARMAAPAAAAYRILADYRSGHPRILPPIFSSLEVEAGGIGEGTRIRFRMRMPGETRDFHAAVTEPEPGRVLVETDLHGGPITTFTVDSEPSGGSRVAIVTEWEAPGIAGWIARLLAPRLLEPVYRQELANLARESAAG